MPQNYNDEISLILYKHKLRLCICEYGTNGMVSNIIAKAKYSKETFIGSYVFNNPTMLKDFNIELDNKEFEQHLGLTALRKTNGDVCLVTYIKDNQLSILIIFMKNIYKKEYSLDNINDQVSESSALALAFLSDVLVKGNK
jgi:hypothetical protein